MVKQPKKPFALVPKVSKTFPAVPKDSHAFPAAPSGFHAIEVALWDQFVRENVFDSKAGLSLLESALQAHARARQCRETVEKDGLSFQDPKTGTIKAHPLLNVERDARSAYMHHLRALKLEVF